jgi:predicted TIM-barrel fold metal-dependent hydrolase
MSHAASEAILEPERPIIDPHHHLWDGRAPAQVPADAHAFVQVLSKRPRYLLHEFLADISSGHKIVATVFLECRSMHRADGPVELRPVGETEFVAGVAAMSASGNYGPVKVCAGIVGYADLLLGDAVTPVLEAHLAAGGGRFRGIRNSASYDPDPAVLGPLARVPAGVYADPRFRAGFARLAPLGLSFDSWLLEPQLPDLIDLATAFPGTRIILNHVGTPLGFASYAGRREERFETWRQNIRTLARCENVAVKLGGLAMPFCNFPSFMAQPAAGSAQLAQEWRPYVETCIEAFGARRAMFESNFPVDVGSCAYDVLWNAFKRIAADASEAEKTALFYGTANEVYRLGL